MIGIGEAGIYSVGAKLGLASQLIYIAFAGGWQFFAFSTMKDKNQVETNSRIFEYLGVISFIATSFICAWSFAIFKILFTQDYLSGYVVAPYLFLAPLMQMLFQVAANQFLVIKKTWPNMFVLSVGAVLNIIFNYFLIPVLGIEGASIATLLGYVVSDIVCVIVLWRMNLMVVSERFIKSSLIMVGFMIAWRLLFSDLFIIGTVAAVMLTAVMILLYYDEVKKITDKFKNRKVKV
jgi:O-antigen/teichoic acid export membrane protein